MKCVLCACIMAKFISILPQQYCLDLHVLCSEDRGDELGQVKENEAFFIRISYGNHLLRHKPLFMTLK